MKRVFWASTGYALGLGSSLYVQRRIRRTVERYTPEEVRRQMADRTRDLADRARRTVVDLREAAIEGRMAMRESESALRAEFDRPTTRHVGSARAIGGLRPSRPSSRPRAD